MAIGAALVVRGSGLGPADEKNPRRSKYLVIIHLLADSLKVMLVRVIILGFFL